MMTDTGLEPAFEELGPVDFVLVEFPDGESHFTGEMAEALAELVESGVVRVLDLLIISKGPNGDLEAYELEDLDAPDELRAMETEYAAILAAEDIGHLAAAMEPGSVAGVIIWENRWAAPFANAARRSGGQLIASGRIPIQALAAALEDAAETE